MTDDRFIQPTDDRLTVNRKIIAQDTDEQLLARFVWYVQNFNPVDFDSCDDYELIKAEILKRMRKEV